ncbi:MAG: hypothetical protein EBS75_07290 [Betaproteobacteria bacterium]|nr:hypothetical protein [Betaproteobacteria bacterium]
MVIVAKGKSVVIRYARHALPGLIVIGLAQALALANDDVAMQAIARDDGSLFWIDRTEVSIAQYRRYAQASAYGCKRLGVGGFCIRCRAGHPRGFVVVRPGTDAS